MNTNVINLQRISFYEIGKKAREIIKYTFKKRIYVALTLVIVVFLLNMGGSQGSELWDSFTKEIKSNQPSAIFNLVSLVFIIALWCTNIIREWHDSLEKYLSVKYYYDKEELTELADQFALLISDSDIRALAQQIGQQKNCNNRLDLDSTNYAFNKTLCYDRNKKVSCCPFWHYEVDVTLRNPPAKEKQYKTKEEYLDIINTNLESLMKKTEKDHEAEIIKVMSHLQKQ